MEQPPSASPPPPAEAGLHRNSPLLPRALRRLIFLPALLLAPLIGAPPASARDALDHVRSTGRLSYGCDMEGGGPYAYIDPDDPGRLVGFEVELVDALAARLGVEAELSQGQWDQLLNVLDAGRVDAVANGYELLPSRVRDYRASRPYYIYQLQLMVREGAPIRSWDDLKAPKPGGGRWSVGVLGTSAAETFARENQDGTVEVRAYTGATDPMMQVLSGRLDATLQDLPAARFYRPQFPGLENVGPPEGRGYYVIYVRNGDEALAGALDRAIEALIADGTLERIYRTYDIWTDAQEELATLDTARVAASMAELSRESDRGWALIWKYRGYLLGAAGTTIVLSVASMPIAIVAGLLIALGRLYGPAFVRIPLSAYVELIRGTPLMLQLFVLFYLANLPPYVAGIAGLAINYSAYEAEIYRAGLQAIPAGQMEAALALGMPRWLALRRVVIPQAVRIVIPPVTNDFIALFKDSSVCSVITIVELSKQYQILANSTGGVLEFALACAVLYLVMSLPLSWLSRWSERRLRGDDRSRATKRGAPE
ncbi:ABC transporter substrate-binding protein/permease [Tautonia plasticadhaerens]|uniref:Inner membrane amino-acid ABC transporter permease protein YecS n=1 Tax=Tautonia plasticadhaerens TaxID=2527974 RepID=A0A518GZV3_9BACT|nr:ABC transporter substrate-binding protein/permease [Tautonia plasticadhaerens]QDV34120.1 Inner membrane amino-acid ABC transporter permease protein YecS [Tautonia plasticadhaerens]